MKTVEQLLKESADALDAARQLHSKQFGCRHLAWNCLSESGPSVFDICSYCGVRRYQLRDAAQSEEGKK